MTDESPGATRGAGRGHGRLSGVDPDDAPADLAVSLVVDVANVMGSRPDGWWRDRAGAASRLVEALAGLPDTPVVGPGGRSLRVGRVLAVVEGRARDIAATEGVEIVRAAADGDSAVVQACAELVGSGGRPVVVTADRGLRARLPAGSTAVGPRWLLDVIRSERPASPGAGTSS